MKSHFNSMMTKIGRKKKEKKTAENHTHCTNSRVEMDGWMDGRDGKRKRVRVTIFSINIKRNQTNQQFAAVDPLKTCSLSGHGLLFFLFHLISQRNGQAKKKNKIKTQDAFPFNWPQKFQRGK